MDARVGRLVKTRVTILAGRFTVDSTGNISLDTWLRREDESRAMRWVDDSTRFLVVSFDRAAEREMVQVNTLPRLLNLLDQGLTSDGRRYRFVGYTESQLSGGSLLFFSEGDGYTINGLLKHFGNLEPVFQKSGYGKYAARLGLSFSSTVVAHDGELYEDNLIKIPDRVALDKSVTTDGCGLIKDSFARDVCRSRGLPERTAIFQVRLGGIKGVLVRYSDAVFAEITKNADALIAYRPSMFKYEGGPRVLELNKVSRPPPSARLNIQFILILLTVGVPIQALKDLLSVQVERIAHIFSDRKAAITFLENSYDVSLDSQAPSSLHQDLYLMLHASFDLSEPRLKWLLDTIRKSILDRLREKLQIEVRDSAQLYGVCDETGTLEEDEVYIDLNERVGLSGRKVLVGKNPAYAPGDLRVFTVVNKPALRVCPANCIVFASSQRCKRSPPDTMSGGDLDGDLFFVCWDPSLIPATPAAPLARPKSASRLFVTLRTMREEAAITFIALQKKKLLGQMSNLWRDIAESSPAIAKDPHCEALVPMIEQALDMAKTGDDADVLRRRFGAVKTRASQRSRDDDSENLKPLRDMVPESFKPSFEHWRPDPDLNAQSMVSAADWARHLAEGNQVMYDFNAELSRAIALKDVDDSPALGSDAMQEEKSERRDRTDEVRDRYLEMYFSGATPEKRLRETARASAWYQLGYAQSKSAFAWLGQRHLCRMKAVARNRGGEVVSVGPLSTPLNPADAGAASSIPSTLGDSWSFVSRQNSTDSLNDARPSIAQQLLTCMELGHVFSMKADTTTRRFLCSTCGENRVEHLEQA